MTSGSGRWPQLAAFRGTIGILVWLLAGLLLAAPVRSEPALVFDASSKQVLLAHEAGAPWYPASLTKLMTVYLTFEAVKAGRLRMDQKIVMSKRAAKEPPSKLGYKPGSRFSVDFAVRFLLVRSGNDIAVALAEAVAGSVDGFVNKMNATSRRLGMSGTRFANPHGLHNAKQVTTARDMGLLAAALYRDFPQYRKYYALHYVTLGKKKLKNRNSLLRSMKSAIGMKTGFICPAGFNLVASARRDGRLLIAVVMGRRSGASRTRYTQVLLEAAFRSGKRAKPVSLVSIRNTGGTPRNMRPVVCTALGVKYTKVEELTGWGASLGKVPGAANAYALLTSKSLIGGNLANAGQGGVMRAPREKKYLALIASLGETQAKGLCRHLVQLNADCDVINPQQLAKLKQDSLAYRAELKKKRARRKLAKKKRKRKRTKKRRPKADR